MLLVVSVAPAHLHSSGKGANRSPLDGSLGLSLAVFLLAEPEVAEVRSPPPGGVTVSGAWKAAAWPKLAARSAAGERRE